MIECQICRMKCKNYIGLASHVFQKHRLSSKDYYDKFIKTENEGMCHCGKVTTFLNMNIGYNKSCSKKCQ